MGLGTGWAGLLSAGAKTAAEQLQKRLESLLLEIVEDIPHSSKQKAAVPESAARVLGGGAARDAALLTGAFAIPGGPLGLITILPDLVSVWRRQAQLVADIAAVYGKSARLDRELMMYCLFKHVSGDAVRDILVRAGHRAAVSRGTAVAIYRVAGAVAGALVQRLTGRFLVTWLPMLGAASVAAYTYRDTKRVAATASAQFAAMADQPPAAAPPKPPRRKKKGA